MRPQLELLYLNIIYHSSINAWPEMGDSRIIIHLFQGAFE